jgi:imidazolonepropionase-like amidohydrolase
MCVDCMLGLVVDRIVSGDRACDADRLSRDPSAAHSPVVVVVDRSNGQIADILFSPPQDLELIIFPPGATLLPGFIDCHVHLTIATDDYQMDHLRRSSAEKALRALKAAQGLLAAGFTTLRSAGDSDIFFPSFAVAKSIESGEFDGPRIVGAGHYISVTGGGGDLNFLAPDSCPCCLTDGVIADGQDEVVKAVRKEIKFGSDWIKVLATGAFMSASTGAKDSPENTHFSSDELHACVQEAARRKVPVMAHAHGADGIKQAAIAGAFDLVCHR